jgi:pimeloyl-ACP methyl ester carboxylesterase
MAKVTTTDGVSLYIESHGDGVPIVFVHELAGSYHAFDEQVGAWKNDWRCVIFNARGYPPSDIPASVDAYSQDIAASDIGAVMDGLGLADAHLIGVSMGAASVLQYAIRHPGRVRSATLTSIGSGADLEPGEYAVAMEELAQLALDKGMHALAGHYTKSPTRFRVKDKNPAGYETFIGRLTGGSVTGITNTMRGVQSRRRSVYEYRDQIAAMTVPTLIVLGAEDAPCVKPSHFINEVLPGARLEVVPTTGHLVNIEEPALYNRLVMGFIEAVEAQRRDR